VDINSVQKKINADKTNDIPFVVSIKNALEPELKSNGDKVQYLVISVTGSGSDDLTESHKVALCDKLKSAIDVTSKVPCTFEKVVDPPAKRRALHQTGSSTYVVSATGSLSDNTIPDGDSSNGVFHQPSWIAFAILMSLVMALATM